MPKAIEIIDLVKTYKRTQAGSNGDVTALIGITLDIESGEFVAVFGPNGSGKTTLLLIVAGVEKASQGTILVNGQPPQKAVTGFVFQNYREALLPWRSCLSNIAFPLEIAGWDTAKRHEKARELVANLDLNIDLESYPYQQSGGQQQLVAIARALVSEPDVLVMDEPLSALDVKARLRMRATIEDIWQRTRKTTLHVSHDVDEAVYLADRIVVLSERPGTIVKIISNPLPRPRHLVTDSADYNALRNEVLDVFNTNGGAQ
jgi:NitT/TauT family transport system ATP-binding protein